jgi:hypothetical protein
MDIFYLEDPRIPVVISLDEISAEPLIYKRYAASSEGVSKWRRGTTTGRYKYHVYV